MTIRTRQNQKRCLSQLHANGLLTFLLGTVVLNRVIFLIKLCYITQFSLTLTDLFFYTKAS